MITLICIFLLLIGAWLAFLNWQCFYQAFVKKEHASSWIPILPGLLLFIGIYFFPSNPAPNFAWLAFVFEWGSLPGIGHAIYYHWHRLKS